MGLIDDSDEDEDDSDDNDNDFDYSQIKVTHFEERKRTLAAKEAE